MVAFQERHKCENVDACEDAWLHGSLCAVRCALALTVCPRTHATPRLVRSLALSLCALQAPAGVRLRGSPAKPGAGAAAPAAADAEASPAALQAQVQQAEASLVRLAGTVLDLLKLVAQVATTHALACLPLRWGLTRMWIENSATLPASVSRVPTEPWSVCAQQQRQCVGERGAA